MEQYLERGLGKVIFKVGSITVHLDTDENDLEKKVSLHDTGERGNNGPHVYWVNTATY